MQSIGTIKYRPNWWIWLECDYQLGKYLRKLFFNNNFGLIKLAKPSWDEHITIVSHHEYNDTFSAHWNKHENKQIQFEIILETLSTNSNAWWYSIKSKELEDIREELGLGRERIIPLHFCIEYEREGKI